MLNYLKNIVVKFSWSMIFFCLRCILLLPRVMWHKIGRSLGCLFFVLMKKRQAVIKKNIELCFPHIGKSKQDELQKHNIQELGIGALDFFVLRFKSNLYISKQSNIIGFDLLSKAVEAKQGVIIFLPHTSTLCIAIGVLSQLLPIKLVYRPFKHEALRSILSQLSRKIGMKLIAQRDVKGIIKALNNKGNIVILPDHDMGRAGASFASFFGIKAATTVSIFKLAKSTGAKIISVYSYRLKSGKVCLEFSNGLNSYCNSSHDDAATAMNKYLETNIKRFPSQYYWPHRRFKTRPHNEENIY